MEKLSKELQTYAIVGLVFKYLKESPSYGYRLIKDMEKDSGGLLRVEEGYLYPLLDKMKKQGLLNSSWQSTSGNQKRKVYSLSNAGINKYHALMSDFEKVKSWMK